VAGLSRCYKLHLQVQLIFSCDASSESSLLATKKCCSAAVSSASSAASA